MGNSNEMFAYFDFSVVVSCGKRPPIFLLQTQSVADLDLELRTGDSVALLALRAFLPYVISSFFTQNQVGSRVPSHPPPPPRSAPGVEKRDNKLHVTHSTKFA